MTKQEQPQQEQLQGDKEKPPITAEELKRAAEQLQKNVEEARRAKEESIKKRLTEHESLIAQAKANEELLIEAKKTYDYFNEMQEKGDLTDPEDLKNLEKIRQSIEQIEEQRRKIYQRGEVIGTQPEIEGRLMDEAETKDKQRTGQKQAEQIKKELEQEIGEIALSIKDLADRNRYLHEQINQRIDDEKKAEQELKNKIEKAIRSRKADWGPFGDLMNKAGKSESSAEFIAFLEEKRGSFGLFYRKEKKVIDSIKADKSIINNFYQAKEKLKEINQEEEKITGSENKLKTSYKKIIEKAKKTDNELKKEFGLSTSLSLSMPYELENEIKKIANIRYEGGGETGKYKNWDEAARNEGQQVGWLKREWEKIARQY